MEHLDAKPALQRGPCTGRGRLEAGLRLSLAEMECTPSRQVRKTTLFLYLAEQPPREREEQGENGGERVLHSK